MKSKTKGFCYTQDNKYAGRHLILDFWGVKKIGSINHVKKALILAVEACQATLLKIELHKFSPQGISGVAVIAESHISIHAWPEYNYLAIDVFTCGQTDPYQAVDSLKKSFNPEKIQLEEIKRGVLK